MSLHIFTRGLHMFSFHSQFRMLCKFMGKWGTSPTPAMTLFKTLRKEAPVKFQMSKFS